MECGGWGKNFGLNWCYCWIYFRGGLLGDCYFGKGIVNFVGGGVRSLMDDWSGLLGGLVY